MVNSSDERLHGSYINGSTCYAKNPSNGLGVYAVARCCDFTPISSSIQCSTTKSEISEDGDDELTSITCHDSAQWMLGWYV